MSSEQSSPAQYQQRNSRSHKIGPRHLNRQAMIYVRQSTLQQTIKNQESTRLQYGLAERALDFGWPRERIVVIDDDLGRSGASAEGRPGFQRLVAEVGLDRVGLILGVEMSRLARSCRDWHQLLEVCAVFGTLIGDTDGIYDPSQYNDRLLLGLKGTMSEAELHVLKQRMLQGARAKAERGELALRLPLGYLRRPSGEVAKDPDEQAQAVVAMIFDEFEKRGNVHAVLRHLVNSGIRIPVRVHGGVNKGELEWRRPNRPTLQDLLRNPIYAGAYAYGRRRYDARRQKPGRPATGRTTVLPCDQWQVCLRNHFPAYIDWARWEAIQEQLAANRANARGVPRRGPSLLAGLLECGRCGYRMIVDYGGGRLRYDCNRAAVHWAEKRCCSVKGRSVDDHIAELVLRALAPAALDVSLRVAEDIETERRRMEQSWRQRLEQAQYEVDRAMRQYNAVEPENRLVARTVERQLEEKLAIQTALQDERERRLLAQPTPLGREEREAIRALASDIPALWAASTTTTAERQTIIRQLIDKVVITVQGDTERVDVLIHWAGGNQTRSSLIRPVARFEQLSFFRDLVKRIVELRDEGLPSDEIAVRLNAQPWRCPDGQSRFTGSTVRAILSRNGLAPVGRKRRVAPPARESEGREWPLPELARELGMPPITLYSWLRRGWVHGQRIEEGRRLWVIRATASELARLRALRAATKPGRRSRSAVPPA
jgi:DNA invertase Pin-like site-specific DNA recombinase